MTLTNVDCGYIPLVDSAPLIIAKELGFATDVGLHLNLLRQPSWAATRDMLVAGHLDAAHLLSPLPIALSLGLNGHKAPIDTLMVLNQNGNTIGVSLAVAEQMESAGWAGEIDTPFETGKALLAALDRPLRIGVPFPFSAHRLLLDYWLRACAGHQADSYQTVTLPPQRMADALANGDIDAFCVGEPWGSVAVQNGHGQIILTGSQIWSGAPEKVLATRRDWNETEPGTCRAMMQAVYRACAWLDTPENKVLAVEILARSDHLALSEQAVDPAIFERILPKQGSDTVAVPGFLNFHRSAVTFPWKSQAAWIAGQLGARSQDAITTAKDCHRTDLYRANLGPIGVALPGASEKVEGALRYATAVASTHGHMTIGPDAFFDGSIFDPSAAF